MEVGDIHHIAIKTGDVEKTGAFYRDVLGLRMIERHLDASGALRSLWLSAGGPIVMIERSGMPSETTGPTARAFADDPPGLHLLAFRIEPTDRSAWRERVEKAGHPIVGETRFTLYVLDPEGNRVGLSSHPNT